MDWVGIQKIVQYDLLGERMALLEALLADTQHDGCCPHTRTPSCAISKWICTLVDDVDREVRKVEHQNKLCHENADDGGRALCRLPMEIDLPRHEGWVAWPKDAATISSGRTIESVL